MTFDQKTMLLALSLAFVATSLDAAKRSRSPEHESTMASAAATTTSDHAAEIATAIKANDMPALTRLCQIPDIDLNTIKIDYAGAYSTAKQYSPLGIATLEDNTEAIATLCAHGAKADHGPHYPFFIAIANQKYNALQALCRHQQAEINTPTTYYGKPTTPLHYAMVCNYRTFSRSCNEKQESSLIRIATILLEHGADPKTKLQSIEHQTLFHFALDERYFKLFTMLCQHPLARTAINEEITKADASVIRCNTVLKMLLADKDIDNSTRYDLIKCACEAGANHTTPEIVDVEFMFNNKNIATETRYTIFMLLFGPQEGLMQECKATIKGLLASTNMSRDFSLLTSCITPENSNWLTISDDNKKIPFFTYIDNYLTSLLLAHGADKEVILPDESKTTLQQLIRTFFATNVTDETEITITIKQYFSRISDTWEDAQIASVDFATPEKIALALSHLETPDPAKVTATIISLPGLRQNVSICEVLYKIAGATREWAESCGFYATFHLINLWLHKNNPTKLLTQLGSRSAFNEFLGTLRSAQDLIPVLKNPDLSLHGELLSADKLTLKELHYPAIYKNIATASQIPLGELRGRQDMEACIASAAFLNGIAEPALHAAPIASNYAGPISITPGNAVSADNTIFMTYLKQKIAAPEAFVFPLYIYTKGHASSAIIYKQQDLPRKAKQFFVFFAESNHNPGHKNLGTSGVGESFDFATFFQQLFGTLTETSHDDITIAGPTDAFQKDDIYSLFAHCENQITNQAEQIYAWHDPNKAVLKLITAIREKDLPVIEEFCATGIDLNNIKISIDGGRCSYSPLGLATLENAPQAIEILCRYGAQPLRQEVVHDITVTPFFIAIEKRHYDALRALCVHANAGIHTRASLHAKDYLLSYTPLQRVICPFFVKHTEEDRVGNESMITHTASILLDHGANPKTRNNRYGGFTLFHFALENTYFSLFEMLCKHPRAKIAINERDEDGKTALDYIMWDTTIDRMRLATLACAAGAKPNMDEYKANTQYDTLPPELVTLLESYAT